MMDSKKAHRFFGIFMLVMAALMICTFLGLSSSALASSDSDSDSGLDSGSDSSSAGAYPVPEPATMSLIILGVGGVLGAGIYAAKKNKF